MQPCTQEKRIDEIQKSLHESDKRDVLQTNEIAMLKDWINKIDLKVDKIDIKLDKFINTLDKEYAKKSSVNRLWTIVWSIVAFVFTSLGIVIVAMVKYFLALNLS